MESREFWIVMGQYGPSSSPYRHHNENLAFTEAKRLASLHGGSFYVLKAVGVAAKVDVHVERFDGQQEIPF